MMVIWPLYKRKIPIDDIEKALKSLTQVPPKVAASIMGKVREIAPWGSYISFSLADFIKKASQQSFQPTQKWWTNRIKTTSCFCWNPFPF
jgi:hypothetical protein